MGELFKAAAIWAGAPPPAFDDGTSRTRHDRGSHPHLAAAGRLAGVRHAFFTRQGGVSEGVYASLNVGVGSGDDPAHVPENRRRAAAMVGVGRARHLLPDPFGKGRPCRLAMARRAAGSRRRCHGDAGPGAGRAGRRLRAGADRRCRGAGRRGRPCRLARGARRHRRRSGGADDATGRRPSPNGRRRSDRASDRAPTRSAWSSSSAFVTPTRPTPASSPPAPGRKSGSSTCPPTCSPASPRRESFGRNGSAATPTPSRTSSSPTAAPCIAANPTTDACSRRSR